MIGKTRVLAELSALARRARADAASLCLQGQTRQVFRFAYGGIHQDLTQETLEVTIKVVRDGRIGIATTGTLERQSLLRCLRTAEAIAAHAPKQMAPPLPTKHQITATKDARRATVHVDPTERVDSLQHLFRICQGVGATLAGSLIASADELAVVNTAGVACYSASTIAGAKLVTMHQTRSGYASGVHQDVAQLDLEALLARSLKQSLHAHDPVDAPLGTYEVILEPEAVADLLVWLAYTAFGAKQFEEGSSCLAGRIGETLMAPEITIVDDAQHADGLRMPFDFEGVPKERVVLIDRGRAAGVVYDTTYGARLGRRSTGHALMPDDTEGPLPLHLTVAAGRSSLADMLRSCRRGLLIPRFHYVNGLLNPREALVTGLTREGTVLIEHGALTSPIRRLRFTQSLLEAFRTVKAVSTERRLVADPSEGMGCTLAPWIHVGAFAFTGRSAP